MQFVSIGSLGPINPSSYWLWRGSEKKRHRTSSWGSAATAGCWSPIDVINWLMNRNTILYSMVAAATLYIVHGELIQFLLYDALHSFIHFWAIALVSGWVGAWLTDFLRTRVHVALECRLCMHSLLHTPKERYLRVYRNEKLLSNNDEEEEQQTNKLILSQEQLLSSRRLVDGRPIWFLISLRKKTHGHVSICCSSADTIKQ